MTALINIWLTADFRQNHSPLARTEALVRSSWFVCDVLFLHSHRLNMLDNPLPRRRLIIHSNDGVLLGVEL
jgi:hypothetical protein